MLWRVGKAQVDTENERAVKNLLLFYVLVYSPISLHLELYVIDIVNNLGCFESFLEQ